MKHVDYRNSLLNYVTTDFCKDNLNTDFEGTVKIFIASPQLSGKAIAKPSNKYKNVLLILKDLQKRFHKLIYFVSGKQILL